MDGVCVCVYVCAGLRVSEEEILHKKQYLSGGTERPSVVMWRTAPHLRGCVPTGLSPTVYESHEARSRISRLAMMTGA